MNRKTIIQLTILIFLIPLSFNAQGLDNFVENFTFYPNKKKVAKDSTLYLSKFIAAPIVSYSPETSFGIGIGAKYLFKFDGSGEETRTSNMPISFLYTLNNQFFLYSGFEIFTNREEWVISGNILFQNYPRSYFGIGRNTSKKNEEIYDNYQILFEPILMKQLFTRYLFLGGGVRYNRVFNVEVEENGLLATTKPSGFDGFTAVGFELAALYDSRDNILNASRGWYLEVTKGFYGKVLGGTHEYKLTRFDLRHYISLTEDKNNVLAFQAVGHFANDDVPFSELALFGNDRIMRGYIEGRFIEENLLAAQVEYRKTFKDSRFGYTVFAGLGDVFNKSNQLKFNELKPNFGAGLRFMLDKKERLNIRFDYGFGEESRNPYLNIAEAF